MHLNRILLSIIIAGLLCYVTGRYFDVRYRRNLAVLFFNSTDTMLSAKQHYPIVLLGNSRVHFGINPYYIDSATGLSSYNFGIGGSGPALLLLNSKLYLKHHPAPKYVVIGADVSMLVAPEGIYSQYHFYYYLNEPDVYNIYRQYHPNIALAKWLPFTKYSFFNEYNRGLLFKPEPRFPRFDHNIYKGFFNTSKMETGANAMHFGIDTIIKPLFDPSIAMMKNVISLWQQAGSTVILVSPPMKQNTAAVKKAFFGRADSVFAEMASQQQYLFLKADSSGHYDDKYFTDDLHLNEPGTRIFSRWLGNYINTLQQKENGPG